MILVDLLQSLVLGCPPTGITPALGERLPDVQHLLRGDVTTDLRNQRSQRPSVAMDHLPSDNHGEVRAIEMEPNDSTDPKGLASSTSGSTLTSSSCR
ncbi:hypothetical protein [Actinokineospora iranica]|uniref:Uncharacterized protein n=1 Tax=Actinokineospora iranica TaxID=1271860 RepID=A0A1G6ZF31_9PSEU|nr:hypothetical protein [Actinokineospora iranica]SDE01269.1 hypothetical protein SAMN05216174_1308 [Actinokineospora iranica]